MELVTRFRAKQRPPQSENRQSSGSPPNGSEGESKCRKCRWVWKGKPLRTILPTVLRGRTNRNRVATNSTSSNLPPDNSAPSVSTFEPPGLVTSARTQSRADNDEIEAIPRHPIQGSGHNNSLRPVEAETVLYPREAMHLDGTSTRHPARAMDLPPLPSNWTAAHDRAICYFDALGLIDSEIVVQIHQLFPELTDAVTAEILDRRLRILDQDLDCPYWREALDTIDSIERARTRAAAATGSAGAGPHMDGGEPEVS